MERYPRSTCVRENPTPADLPMEPALVLKSGAAKTWGAIFFCVYTDQIRFASLVSQNMISSEARGEQGDYPQESRGPPQDSAGFRVPLGAITVEACSPKSIYRLANEVGLTGLCDIALNDIQSKLDKNNIVQELFSPFAASHKRVREMEHELFQSKLKASVDGALLSDIIRGCSSGENSYRAAAVELILERSIKERRERTIAKVENTPRLELIPQVERSNEESSTSILEVQSPTPSPVPEPPSQLSPMAALGRFSTDGLVSTKPQASLDSLSLAKRAKKAKMRRREEPPVVVKTNPPPPSEDIVQLVCRTCRVKQSRSELQFDHVYCKTCTCFGWPRPSTMECVGCGRARTGDTEACTGCHKEFE